MAFETLRSEIIDRSVSKQWETARREWSVYDIWLSDEPDVCLCGHSPIKEICDLENGSNGAHVVVGNCCVQRFMELESGNLFAGLRRIKEDTEKSMNWEMIQHAWQMDWITEWEYVFCVDTIRKRKLSPKQNAIRVRINESVMARCVRRAS